MLDAGGDGRGLAGGHDREHVCDSMFAQGLRGGGGGDAREVELSGDDGGGDGAHGEGVVRGCGMVMGGGCGGAGAADALESFEEERSLVDAGGKVQLQQVPQKRLEEHTGRRRRLAVVVVVFVVILVVVECRGDVVIPQVVTLCMCIAVIVYRCDIWVVVGWCGMCWRLLMVG